MRVLRKYLATSTKSLVKPKAHTSTTEKAGDTARPYTCTRKVQGPKRAQDTYCPNWRIKGIYRIFSKLIRTLFTISEG